MSKREKQRGELARQDDPYEITPFREMERYLDDFFKHPFSMFGYPLWRNRQQEREAIVSPTVDIFEDGEQIVVRAELPGLSREDLNVDISDNRITISGEKKSGKEVNREDYHRIECSYGSFRRSFVLPENVVSEQAKATFRNGVLEIRMPQSEKSKKRRISID